METLADLMDYALMPENGGKSEAGKAIFRKTTAAARAQMEQIDHALRRGATDDNG